MRQFERLAATLFSEPKSDLDWYLNRLKPHQVNNHSHLQHPHKHQFYSLFLFEGGSGKHWVDFEEFDIVPGAVFILHPEQVHHWEFDETTDGWVFFCSASFYNRWIAGMLLDEWPFFKRHASTSHLVLETDDVNHCSSMFQQLFIAKQELSLVSIDILAVSTFNMVCFQCCKSLKQEKLEQVDFRKNDYFLRFRELVNVAFRKEHQVKYYANELAISTKHLQRVCNEVTGRSPQAFIHERLLLESKRLLITTTQTVEEIAESLGFTSSKYFHQFFKLKTEQTPQQFRLV